MPRPRLFDENTVLEQAALLFSHLGYAGTTTRDLVAALNIGHQSLYNAFGNKLGLYHRSLKFYQESTLDPLLAILESNDASRPEIVKLFARWVNHLSRDRTHSGCLLCSAALERGAIDPVVSDLAVQFREQLASSFGKVLAQAENKRECPRLQDRSTLATACAGTFLGMVLAAASGADRNELVDMVSITLRPLYS